LKPIDEQEMVPVPNDDIDERRRRVKEMLLRGVPRKHMAQFLGVHSDTIRNDEAAIKVELREKYKNYDITTHVGEVAEALDMIARRSMMEAEATKSKRDRNSFFNTAIRAWVAKAHTVMDPGVMPHAMGGLNRTINKINSADYEPTVKRVIQNPDSRRKLLSVLGQVIRSSRPKTKIIDADIVIKSRPNNGGQKHNRPESDSDRIDWGS